MNGGRHQIGHCGVNQAVAGEGVETHKGLARDRDVKVAATLASARMPDMQGTIVTNF